MRDLFRAMADSKQMFYYAINIIYPTMINVFFSAEGDYKYQAVLTLPSNLGLTFGAVLLTVFGSKIGHWRWTLTASVTIMVVFGALLAVGTPDRKGFVPHIVRSRLELTIPGR